MLYSNPRYSRLDAEPHFTLAGIGELAKISRSGITRPTFEHPLGRAELGSFSSCLRQQANLGRSMWPLDSNVNSRRYNTCTSDSATKIAKLQLPRYPGARHIGCSVRS
jgi:hypothetical protein